MMIGVYKLFMPEDGVGTIYFWLTFFFVGSTMITLPTERGAELSPDYHQRSRVTATREFYVLAD